MKTKNLFFGMFAIMMMAAMSVGFTSCSSGDDDDDVANVVEPSDDDTAPTLVGTTWIGTNDNEVFKLTFTSSSAGKWTSTYVEDGVTDTESGTFRYTLKSSKYDFAGTIKVTYDDGEKETVTFTVTGSKLTIYDEDGDAGWILSKQGSDAYDDGEITPSEDYSSIISGRWNVDIDGEESCELIIDFQGKGKIFFSDLINQDEGVTAKGTYTLSGNKITAVYNNVSVYTESGSTTFSGFTDGVTKTVTYTIVSCNEVKMVLKDSNGKTLNYKKTANK